MTIPRKNRRSITVNEVVYHYKAAIERSERVVIQRADGIGATLFVFPFSIMKPLHISDAIGFAMRHSWNSKESSKSCWLVFAADEAGNSCFEYIPSDDFRVVTYASRGVTPKNTDVSQFEDTRPWYLRPKPSSIYE